jgi:hypothetical protein
MMSLPDEVNNLLTVALATSADPGLRAKSVQELRKFQGRGYRNVDVFLIEMDALAEARKPKPVVPTNAQILAQHQAQMQKENYEHSKY